MTLFHRSALARLGAVALLAVGGLATVAAPASAADQATLDLVPLSSQLALGVKEAKAKPFKFSVQNVRGTVDAKDVKVTVETAGLKANKVGVLVPDGCAVSGTAFTCSLSDLGGTTDDIAAGTTEEFGIPLFGTDTRGKGGVLKVTVSGSNTTSDSVDHDIMVVKPGYDLTTWVQDVYADVVVDGDDAGETGLTGVKPGGTAPLDWAVYNGGSRRATGVFYGIALPEGASFVDLPESCVTQDLGGVVAYCEDSGAVLRPGEFYTADVRVKVGTGVTEKVLTPGVLFAAGLTEAEGTPEEKPQVASKAQRKVFTETDDVDNTSLFDVFVDLSTGPSPSPSPTGEPSPSTSGQPSPSTSVSPTTGGGTGGGDGGLPVTGAQATLIGGIGAVVLLAGGALLMLARRRRLVLVTPGDEKPRS
ncbi:LPXTG cell wall anchor domain-containing protein [Micromonospora sp. WMMD723]|uniref:LPXTG cell wall anchor domain-containing protein n=1 Tax=Micromonospora sp. WMMD723 TaxID=3403465 RepID=UPI003CFA93E3